MNILLVEPNKSEAKTFMCSLDAYDPNWHISVAPNAQTAIVAADQIKPDIVVLELKMAEHNGLAFIHEFRSYEDWQAVPIVIHSHIAAEEAGLTIKEWEAFGVVDYLYKPTTRLFRLARTIEQTTSLYEAV